MKIKTLVLATLIAMLTTAHGWAAINVATGTIRNGAFTAQFRYTIEIYAFSNAIDNPGAADPGDFELGITTLTVNYNSAALGTPVLSDQNTIFHNNPATYDAMSLNTGTAGQVGLEINPSGGSLGALLSRTEILLAKISFDILDPALLAGISANIGITSMQDISGGPVFLSWTGTDDRNMTCAPDIDGIPASSVMVGDAYSFIPTELDVCSLITYSAASLPNWAGVDPITGELSGTPAFGDIGTFADVEITATDIVGSDSIGPFDIDVVCPPAPTISGVPAPSVAAGNPYSFTPTLTGGCGTLTYAIQNPPSWSSFSTTTGTLSGTPSGANMGTTTGIEISVTDENLDQNTLGPFDIEVTCATLPTISGTPIISIVAGDIYSFSPFVTDGCGVLTFSIQNPPAWASFDTSTGVLSGTPALTDVGTALGIVISVADQNTNSSNLSAFDIEVTPNCVAPLISGTADITVEAGSAYSFTPTPSNGCGTLTYSIQNMPTWASFDTATGALTGTPVLGDVGLDTGIVIAVTDMFNDTASLTAFDIEVTPNCVAPLIAGTPEVTVEAGSAYAFTPAPSSGCGTLTYSIQNMPAWASFDTATGALTGTPGVGDVGTDAGIVIAVTDMFNDSSSLAAFDILVTAAPPVTPASGSGGGGGGGGCFINSLDH